MILTYALLPSFFHIFQVIAVRIHAHVLMRVVSIG